MYKPNIVLIGGDWFDVQILEMHLAGFTWHILNNAFTCHRGFKKRRQSRIRIEQTSINAARFSVSVIPIIHQLPILRGECVVEWLHSYTHTDSSKLSYKTHPLNHVSIKSLPRKRQMPVRSEITTGMDLAMLFVARSMSDIIKAHCLQLAHLSLVGKRF